MKSEIVARQIAFFEKRFGKPHLYLAYHAAFPLALTPELMYRLWATFQRDIHGQTLNIPWVAVGNILLSNLCNEVGHELYEMDKVIRNELLRQLKADQNFGLERIIQLSDFLLEYVRQQLLSDDPETRDFAKGQQWTALAYIRPTEAARQIALAFRQLELLSLRKSQPNRIELVRMTSLVETFAEPLVEAELEPLITYARGMARFAHGDLEGATTQIGQVAEDGKLQIAGVDIPIPEQVKEHLNELSLPESLDFSGQTLRGHSFKDQNLAGANFSRTDICSANFANAILVGANFSHTRTGLQRRWAVGLILCSFLLALLSGFAASSSGWMFGWVFNTGQGSLGVGVISLIAFAIGLVTLLRRGVEASTGAIALAIWGSVAITAFELLTLQAILPQSMRSGNPVVFTVAFAGEIIVMTALANWGHRTRTQTLPFALIATTIGVVLGIAATATVWIVNGLSIQTVFAMLTVETSLAGAGAGTVFISGAWKRSGALTGLTAAVITLAAWWLLNFLSPVSRSWIATAFIGAAAIVIAWAVLITLMLAMGLIFAEIESRLFARVWTLAAFLFGPLILLFITLLGEAEIYPLFKVADDLPMIVTAVIVMSGLGFFVSRHSLSSGGIFKEISNFAIVFAVTRSTRFRAADLTDSNFTQSTLKFADFRQTNLAQARWLRSQKLDSVCAGGNYLIYPQMRHLITTGIGKSTNFDGLNLQEINLRGVELTHASFIGTNLQDANLQGADLSGAVLVSTLLDQADLTGVYLTGAYFQNTKITTTTRMDGIKCEYIFTRLPSQDNPDPARKPEDLRRTFSPREFTNFVQSLLEINRPPI